MDIPSDFRRGSIDRSLENLVRVAPWAVVFALGMLGLFRFLPFAHLDPRLRDQYLLGDMAFLAWSCLAWWAGRRALRTGRLKAQTLNLVHGLVLVQSGYMTVLGNIHEQTLFGLAVCCFALPGVFYVSPRRYRVGIGLLLVAIAVPLYGLIDHPGRFPSIMGQAVALAILSSLLQAHLFRSHLDLFRHMVRLMETNRELALTAAQDPLTGLPNRRSFDERFRQEWVRSRRHGSVFSLVSVDLDFFKRINDTHGHAFGDRVLKEMGALLAGMVRRTDMAARMGGEEFLVLLAEADLEGGRVFAQRLREAVPCIPAAVENGAITASLGVVSSCEGEAPDELLLLVDRRLYRAKHQGRDRVIAGD